MQSYLKQLFLEDGLPEPGLLAVFSIVAAIIVISIILYFIIQRVVISRLEKRVTESGNLINPNRI